MKYSPAGRSRSARPTAQSTVPLRETQSVIRLPSGPRTSRASSTEVTARSSAAGGVAGFSGRLRLKLRTPAATPAATSPPVW